MNNFINRIEVQGYKCLLNESLSISNLNLFVGSNASGKSSFLQCILLLRQSLRSNRIHALHMSGPLFEGGLASDILHPECNRKINLSIKTGVSNFTFEFELDKSSDEGSSVRVLPAKENIYDFSDLWHLEIFTSNFLYLNAERASPKVRYSLPTVEAHLAGALGIHGEYTTAFLADASIKEHLVDNFDAICASLSSAALKFDGLNLESDLKNTGGRIDLISNIILSWLIPGAKFKADKINDIDSSTLSFLRDNENTKTSVRATHIGFGLTYLLPVIVGALLLKGGGILIVENPEAHLHPFSQSRIGLFLALMSTNKQIFIETHSDHVVNGIRLAVSAQYLEGNKLKTHFFKKPIDGTTASTEFIECDKDGYMDHWPEGFFDQIESDLAKL